MKHLVDLSHMSYYPSIFQIWEISAAILHFKITLKWFWHFNSCPLWPAATLSSEL